MKKLTLSEIWIYPVKSLGGIPLLSTKILPKGLPLDRRWMLVDSQGKFMTQRIYPAMALFTPEIVDEKLLIHHKSYSLTVPLNGLNEGDEEKVIIWNDLVTAHEVGKFHSQWFSDLLGMKCRLVYFPEQNPRAVDPRYKVNDENVSLADAYPFLIIGQSSLDDLNTKLSQPVPINRFRPNFVFSGGDPYEEDTWRNFSIGDNRFVGVKLCSRCVLTTVDQETGVKGAEPLKTLSTYRAQNNKVYFGQNLVAIDHGEIKAGDPITIDSYQ